MSEFVLNYAGTTYPISAAEAEQTLDMITRVGPASAETLHLAMNDGQGNRLGEVVLLFTAGIPISMTAMGADTKLPFKD